MRSGIMLAAYIAVFIIEIVLLVLAIRKNSGRLWLSLFLSEVIPLAAAFCLMQYFDGLPGFGFMPGLSYFGEVISSLGAVILYAAALAVSVCAFAFVQILKKKADRSRS